MQHPAGCTLFCCLLLCLPLRTHSRNHVGCLPAIVHVAMSRAPAFGAPQPVNCGSRGCMVVCTASLAVLQMRARPLPALRYRHKHAPTLLCASCLKPAVLGLRCARTASAQPQGRCVLVCSPACGDLSKHNRLLCACCLMPAVLGLPLSTLSKRAAAVSLDACLLSCMPRW